jgi:hypothetical protein
MPVFGHGRGTAKTIFPKPKLWKNGFFRQGAGHPGPAIFDMPLCFQSRATT